MSADRVSGPSVNLQDLRGRLTFRVALVLIGASGLPMLVLLGYWPFPLVPFGLLLAIFLCGWIARAWVDSRPALARHLIVWVLFADLMGAMLLLPDPWLPFLGLAVGGVSAILLPGSEFVSIALMTLLAFHLTQSGERAYPIGPLSACLGAGILLNWAAVRTLYTALEWTWTMQVGTQRLLEEARTRQGELARVLNSWSTANHLLRRTQRELVSARRQAEEARLMKEQFAANVSHELRTPLNLILGFSEVMCLSPEVYGEMSWPPALRQDIYQIFRSSRHLLEMIDDILDLPRFEIAGFILSKEATPVGDVVRDAVDMAAHLFHGRAIHLDVAVEDDLPVLSLDRTRIRQVLLNLLANAARFTEQGTVWVEARQGEGEVLISVRDTGPGIPPEQLPHIFEEFYQVDRSLQRRQGGTGLGLAISKRFVQAHEGRIRVESQLGAGSTFTFSLPVPGVYIPYSDLSRGDQWVAPDPEMAPTVLVFDPDPDLANLVRRRLKECAVIQVEDPANLPEMVLLHHPRAVVCNAPAAPFGAARRSFEGLSLPVPVPTFACSLPSQAWRARELGATACLTKPVTAEQLRREIRRLPRVRDVLVVDDDRAFGRLVERILKAEDAQISVRQAYNGQEGLEAMRGRRPDLLFLDLIMPDVDGFQVREMMQEDEALSGVPVVLVTATDYAPVAPGRRGGRIVVDRQDGLTPDEVLSCLSALVGVLRPRYDERTLDDAQPM